MRTRAYRRHQRARVRARHLRELALYASSATPLPRDIAVRHPLDCGRRCLLCHWSKFLTRAAHVSGASGFRTISAPTVDGL
jgi:hypothetical protein